MKKGVYTVTGGLVHQQFDSGAYTIVDVNEDVQANAIKKVRIQLK